MSSLNVVEFKKEDLTNSMLVIGFSSRGFVGTIAATFVAEQIKLRPFAGLYGDGLPPTMIGRDGTAYSPVRFYTGAARCGPGGTCDKVVAAVGDIPLDPGLLSSVARAIVAWAQAKKVALIVVAEGVDSPPPEGKGSANSQVFGLRSVTSRQDLPALGAVPLAEAVVSSPAAAILMAANERRFDAVALFVHARDAMPDARAASHLLRRIDKLLPRIDLAPTALERRAKQMEKALQESLKDAASQMKSMKTVSEMMYH